MLSASNVPSDPSQITKEMMEKWTRGATMAIELNEIVKKSNENFGNRISELERKQNGFALQTDMTQV